MLRQAVEIAEKAHAGQTDKAGVPYIRHPEYVAGLVSSEREKTVAYLHDVIEDTAVTREDLLEVFPNEIVDAVCVLTKQPGVSYGCYLERVKADPLARVVKLADLTHNMQLERLDHPTAQDYERLEKYKKAYAFLSKL